MEEALKFNDEYSIYTQVLDIYVSSNKAYVSIIH